MKVKKINADGTHTLISIFSYPTIETDPGLQENFEPSQVLIANGHASSANTVALFIDDELGVTTSAYYYFQNLVIPAGVTFRFDLEDSSYNPTVYALKLTTEDNGGATDINVWYI